MGAPRHNREVLDETAALVHKHGSVRQASRASGIPYATFQHRYEAWKQRVATEEAAPTPAPEPPSDLPFDERLAQKKRRNAVRIAHAKAQAWQEVQIPVDGPYGICWFGDPHLDDPYCDLEAIERHAALCRDTPGLYGANGGDSVNNWVGKLERLYAEQSTTASEGWELVDWMLNGLGIRWLCWILGNHDVWNHGLHIFTRMNTRGVLMRDWDAKLRLISPDGGECAAWVRHDFKGTSIYNELHGLKRAALMQDEADIYAAFHRHESALASGELANGRRYTLLRARGYKESDQYAIKGQYNEQQGGQSVVTVVDAKRGLRPKVHAFDDVETGADFLTFLRRKAGL